MGFNSVYKCLMDVFPQVDARLLKAVAIEHSKDADTAVEIVLSEVIPFLEGQSRGSNSSHEDHRQSAPGNGGDTHEEPTSPTNLLTRRQVRLEKTVGSSSETKSITKEDASKIGYNEETSESCSSETRSIANDGASKTDRAAVLHHEDSTRQERVLHASTCDTNVDTNQLQGDIEGEELILLGNLQGQEDDIHLELTHTSIVISNSSVHEDNAVDWQACANTESKVPASLDQCLNDNTQVGCELIPEVISASLIDENVGFNGSLIGNHCESKHFDALMACDFDMVVHGKSPQVESCAGVTALKVASVTSIQEDVDFAGSLTVYHNEHKDSDVLVADDLGMTINEEDPQVESFLDRIASEAVVEQMPNAAECSLQSEFASSPINGCENVKSKQDVTIELLDQFVEAAKTNKKTLFSSMESVMNTMRQVELHENAVEQAKEEAARGGFGILLKVQELKQMLSHARQANDMNAGEVYGEKAILATEMRELEARLLSLSDERDKALAILDEMRQSLEARLSAAEELRKAVEQEKLEKEESARKALAEQEIIMEKVVRESKVLQQEAEENSKLREFLMDRGHMVDVLQGEISVICHDVRLLKAKFDDRVPLSKSISSSQTSCILASSGSSLGSMTAFDLVPELGETSKSPNETSPVLSLDGESPKSRHEKERATNDRKELLDDGWDFFENDFIKNDGEM